MCRSFLLFARLIAAVASVLAAAACDWQPKAKPIQPERILEGSFRVDQTLDEAQRYVLVTRDPADDAKRRRLIVEWDRKRSCELPEEIESIEGVLPAGPEPTGGALFLIPIIVGEDERELYYADQDCNLRGPYGRTSSTSGIVLDETQQTVTLKGNGEGTLSLVNPWTDEVREIATNVSEYYSVRRPTEGAGALGVQALWTLENGVLNQRTLTGELLFSRGQNVTEFVQALFDTLRVAYVANGDLYEAAGPDFIPVLLAQDACGPFYSGVELNLYSPCADEQLVRIDLTTGDTQLFEEDIVWSYSQAGFLLEYYMDDAETLTMYVTAPDQQRYEISPPLVDYVQVVDAITIVGRTQGGTFGLWNTFINRVEPLVENAGRPLPFVDTRSSELLWLLLHDIDEETRIGTLSLYNQTTFEGETVAVGVPSNGFTAELLIQISEPTLIIIEDASYISETDLRRRGRLRARLLSGELGSPVDEEVTSYVSIYAPLAGLLYSVEDGPRSGLWFAAL